MRSKLPGPLVNKPKASPEILNMGRVNYSSANYDWAFYLAFFIYLFSYLSIYLFIRVLFFWFSAWEKTRCTVGMAVRLLGGFLSDGNYDIPFPHSPLPQMASDNRRPFWSRLGLLSMSSWCSRSGSDVSWSDISGLWVQWA